MMRFVAILLSLVADLNVTGDVITNNIVVATLGLPKGQYFIAGSATNATAESDISVEILWDYTNPNKPSNFQVQ